MEAKQSQKGGEVRVFNPDEGDLSSKVVEPLRKQVDRLVTTIEPCLDTLQKVGTTRKKEIKARRNLATLKVGLIRIDNGGTTELQTTRPVIIGLYLHHVILLRIDPLFRDMTEVLKAIDN